MRFAGVLVAGLLLVAIYFVLDDSVGIENGEESTLPIPLVENSDLAIGAVPAENLADADPRADVQAESIQPEQADVDPIEQGECSLEVQFFDAATYGSVSGRVQLWRMGAPGNNNWSSGDQLLVEEDILKGVLAVDELAAGTYRVHALFARRGSALAPTFEVQGKHTLNKCHVDMPSTQEVNLQIYRTDGSLYAVTGEQVDLRKLGWKIHSRETDLNWVKDRHSKVTGFARDVQVKEANGAKGKRRWSPRPESDLGTYLGFLLEGDRRSMRTYAYHLRKGKDSSIKIKLPHQASDVNYVAVYIEPKELQACVVFPEGAPSEDLSQFFLTEAIALPAGDDPGQKAKSIWQNVEVTVQMVPMGYKAHSFTWRPIDGPLPKIHLQPLGGSD